MKKYLPLILVGVGIFAILLVLIFVKISKKPSARVDDEANVPELPQNQWPLVSLTPTDNPTVKGSDGHWLDLKVQKINVPGAASMDYLLVYNTSSGGQQGVPGVVKLTGSGIERKLLLGSESSGKFRYDVGVEKGTMTITFRDARGKSMGKLSTEFTLKSLKKGVFEVTMNTFADGIKTFSSSK